jgi:hypothetical protein
MNRLIALVFTILVFCTPLISHAKAIISSESDFQCLMWAVYKESRGESVKAQRAVLDTIQHRIEAKKKTACQVLKESGQFPYFKYGIKKVDKEWLTKYLELYNMEPVLKDKRYVFFNDKKFSWGTGNVKIGKLWFSRLKESRK